MDYPTREQVKKAGRETICKWYRFLPSPEGDEQAMILYEITEKFRKFGGFTPQISKKLGWKNEE